MVKGLAGASFLLPTSAADLAAMTGTRFGEAVYAITPIDGHIRLLGEPKNYTYANVTYADKVLTYANGNTITKIGGGTAASCALNAYTSGTKLSDYMYDARYYIGGWGGDNWQDNGLVFKMKATSRLVGNLRFGFSLFGAANSDLPKNWKVVWSADNVNWNEGAQILSFKTDVITAPESLETTFELPGSANAGGYKLAIFNIPDNKAVAEGSYLYVKVCQADNVSLSGNPVDPAKQVISSTDSS